MKEHPQCERVRWGDFCADPLSMGTHCQQHPHCCAVFPDFYWHHVIDQVGGEGEGQKGAAAWWVGSGKL